MKKLVEHRKELISTFNDKNQPWHKDTDLPSRIANGLSDFLSDEVKYLGKSHTNTGRQKI